MSLKIRLARAGTKKRPVYHIVDRRRPLAARRPLHRAARLFQPAAAEGQDRAAQARPRQGQGLARQGRAADRPRVALPRRGRPDEAREAQQSRQGRAAQGAQGAGRSGRKAAAEAKAAAAAAKAAAAGNLTIAAALVADRICVARIGAAHGMRGEVRLNSFTADPMAVTRYGSLSNEDGTRVFEIESCGRPRTRLMARLQGRRRPHRRRAAVQPRPLCAA